MVEGSSTATLSGASSVPALSVDTTDTPAAVAPKPASLSISATPTSTTTTRHLERTSVNLPIVHGSVAFYLGKKADEFQSHQWTLYLRGPRNEDISQCIQKVVFHLHASFAQPVREFTAPPFAVTEKGWGEFEAQIKIHWKDPTESMTMVTHGIKLHPPGVPGGGGAVSTDTQVPVVSEIYDEVVFTDPTEAFFQQLMDVRKAPSIESDYAHHEHFQTFSDADDALALLEAQRFLQQQLLEAKERLQVVDDALELVEADLEKAHEPQPNRVISAASKTSPSHVASTPKTANKHKSMVGVSDVSSTRSDGRTSPGKKVKQK